MSRDENPKPRDPATPCQPLKRVRYSSGQLLSKDDLVAEQEYFLEKIRRHNRFLHRPGVITGLEVTLQPAGIRVEPGLALDPGGNEICVPLAQMAPLPLPCPEVFVVLCYAETATDPIPALGDSEPAEQVFSRIQESFALAYDPPAGNQPSDAASGVRLARLTNVRGKWSVDQRFRRARAR